MSIDKTMHKPVERILLDRRGLESLEVDIFLRRHIERYAMVRHHLYGTVLDCACGVGYGSYLISKNPDVKRVIGVDHSAEAIAQADQEFAYEKTTFMCRDIAELVTTDRIDVLLSIETIEHLPDPQTLPSLVRRLNIPHVIVSFPSKKTTHYNRHHYHDFRTQDVADLFDEYLLYRTVDLHGEVEMLFFTLHPRLISAQRPARDGNWVEIEDDRSDCLSQQIISLRKPPK